MQNDELDKGVEFLKPFAKQIKEAGEFDSVLIIATKSDDKESATISTGSGNLYLANWSAEEYLIRQRHYATPKDE